MGKAIENLRQEDVRYHRWSESDVMLRAAILELAISLNAHYHEVVEPGTTATQPTSFAIPPKEPT